MELLSCTRGTDPVDFFYGGVRSLPENLPRQLDARYLQGSELLGEAGRLDRRHCRTASDFEILKRRTKIFEARVT